MLKDVINYHSQSISTIVHVSFKLKTKRVIVALKWMIVKPKYSLSWCTRRWNTMKKPRLFCYGWKNYPTCSKGSKIILLRLLLQNYYNVQVRHRRTHHE